MNCRALLMGVIIVSLCGGVAEANDKRGIGLTKCARDGQRVRQLPEVSWYYTWSPDPVPDVGGVEFVPMAWTAGGGLEKATAEIKALSPRHVLGFNEPDRDNQANLTVEQAVAAWPRIEQLAPSVGSPAAAAGMGPWMHGFTATAARDRLKIDFVAVHWYGPPIEARLMNFLAHIHEQYGKPIWITEFAVTDPKADEHGGNEYSPQVVMNFMSQVLPDLDRSPYVERYAWFGMGCTDAGRLHTSRLFTEDGRLTDLGRFYGTSRAR